MSSLTVICTPTGIVFALLWHVQQHRSSKYTKTTISKSYTCLYHSIVCFIAVLIYNCVPLDERFVTCTVITFYMVNCTVSLCFSINFAVFEFEYFFLMYISFFSLSYLSPCPSFTSTVKFYLLPKVPKRFFPSVSFSIFKIKTIGNTLDWSSGISLEFMWITCSNFRLKCHRVLCQITRTSWIPDEFEIQSCHSHATISIIL